MFSVTIPEISRDFRLLHWEGVGTVTISRVKFPWPPFFRIFIFFDETFNSARGTTYLMRDDGATVVNVRP
mgnify:CR=1 FL=1